MKTYKFTLYCLEKDFHGKTTHEHKGDNLEDAALRFIAKYHNHRGGEWKKYGKIDDPNIVQFYGYVYCVFNKEEGAV